MAKEATAKKAAPAAKAKADLKPGSGRAFTALEDFEAEETRSAYAKGMSYTARWAHLDPLVDQWVKDGKVALGGAPAAELRGE